MIPQQFGSAEGDSKSRFTMPPFRECSFFTPSFLSFPSRGARLTADVFRSLRRSEGERINSPIKTRSYKAWGLGSGEEDTSIHAVGFHEVCSYVVKREDFKIQDWKIILV